MPRMRGTSRGAQGFRNTEPDTERRSMLRTSLAACTALAAGRMLGACGDASDLPAAPSRPDRPKDLPDEAARAADAGMPRTERDAVSVAAGVPAAVPMNTGGAPARGETSISSASSAAANPPRSFRLACAKPTQFAPFNDEGLRTSFRRTQDSTSADWVVISLMGATHLLSLSERILSLLRALSALHLGYPISMLEHSLQTATRARRAGAPDDLVIAALCHRIGMAITIEGYAELSAAIVRGMVSEDAYHIVRHLPEYAGQADARLRYASQPWHEDAMRLHDAWAAVSYDPQYDSEPLTSFEDLVNARFVPNLEMDPYKTHEDCVQGAK